MAKKIIDVANIKEVRIGYQYELNIDTLVFTGIEFEGTIRMGYSHKDIKNSPQFIPLKKTDDGYELPIDGLFEELSGKYVCTIYGYDLNADGSIEKRKLYPQFILYKEPAQNVKKSKEAKHVPAVLKDIYDSFVELINDIKNKLESGYFKGEPGIDGTVSDEQIEEIVEKVTDKVPGYDDTEIRDQVTQQSQQIVELRDTVIAYFEEIKEMIQGGYEPTDIIAKLDSAILDLHKLG